MIRCMKKRYFHPQSVRDWSGILCQRSENVAGKDIAESPTRSGTPQKKDYRQQTTVSRLYAFKVAKNP